MKRVGIYVRVSTQDQDTENQKRDLLPYVANRGWDLRDIYEDRATGTNTKRPGFQKLIADCKSRKIDVVLVWKLDRMFRSMKDMVNHLNEIQELGIEFISLKDQIDVTTASGKLFVHIIGAFAEFETSLIKERIAAGLRTAKARGKKLGRPKKRHDRAIRTMRERGYSFREIAKGLGVSLSSVQAALKSRS